MEILVFYPDPARLNLISLCLESEIDTNITLSSSFGDTIKYLLENKEFDLIIVGVTKQLPDLMKYLLSVGAKIPLILVGPEEGSISPGPAIPDLPILAEIKDTDIPNTLLDTINAHFKNLPKIETPDNQNFCRINVELLCDITPLIGDVFVRLSSVKFVKIFNSGTIFTEKDLHRFLGIKKVDYLYIKHDSAGDFIGRLNSRLVGLSESAAEGDISILSTVGHAHETIQDLSLKIGFTEPVMELAKSQVKLAMKAIGKFPRLQRVFEGSLLQNVNYTSQHSLMLAHISCVIATKLGWNSDSTFQKLVIAAFLHDITLTRPELAKINSKKELAECRDKLPIADYKCVEGHSFASAQLVDKFLEIPGDIYQVVFQHHEKPDGSGFPHGLRSSAIAPLASIFIVAHELVDAYFEHGKNFDMEKFWAEKNLTYTSGTFKKIAKCFNDNKIKAA